MCKKLISVLIVCTLCFSISACTNKDSEKKDDQKKYDPKTLVEEAVSNMEKEDLKSVTVKTVNTYDNGIEDTEDCTYVYDTKKEMIESKTLDEYGEEIYLHSFYVKNQDQYTIYTKDGYNSSGWISYNEELEEDEMSDYETIADEFSLNISEENGFMDVDYSYEGEEVLDDIDTLKVKVDAKETFDSGIEEVVRTTRQSVLDEYGWTEEEVTAIEGFSDILDAYVNASNQADGETLMNTSFTIWINAKDHQLVRVRMEQDMESTENDSVKKANEAFEENFWKMDMLHYNITENGKSIEEAKKIVKESEDGVSTENLQENDEEDELSDEVMTQQYESLLKSVITKRYKTGEDCPAMGELPGTFETMTMDEYFNAGVEEYFQ